MFMNGFLNSYNSSNEAFIIKKKFDEHLLANLLYMCVFKQWINGYTHIAVLFKH